MHSNMQAYVLVLLLSHGSHGYLWTHMQLIWKYLPEPNIGLKL